VGDIYRLMGAVVLRQKGAQPAYAGYIASAFLLPKGTNNNRVTAAGGGRVDLLDGPGGPGLPGGTAAGHDLPGGTTFGASFQIDPSCQ